MLSLIISSLEKYYSKPKVTLRKPFEMIIHENVAYLGTDEAREKTYQELKKQVGIDAKKIQSAPKKQLLDAIKLGGMLPEMRLAKLQKIAELALTEFTKDFLDLPTPKIRRSLKKFPGIGDPGADKIMLFSGVEANPAFESNALRVLTRLGIIAEQKNYSKNYKAAQITVRESLKNPEDFSYLEKVYLLLREHGKTLCKTNKPDCKNCPVLKNCKNSYV